MANKSLVTSAIGLVVGAAVALLLIPSTRFTTWGIVVGDTGSPDDPSHISLPDLRMYRADQIHWQAYVTGKGTYIEFEKQIFQKMSFNSGPSGTASPASATRAIPTPSCRRLRTASGTSTGRDWRTRTPRRGFAGRTAESSSSNPDRRTARE